MKEEKLAIVFAICFVILGLFAIGLFGPLFGTLIFVVAVYFFIPKVRLTIAQHLKAHPTHRWFVWVVILACFVGLVSFLFGIVGT
jgi:hypothetical protein